MEERLKRYSRQLLLQGVGIEGQQKLFAARVLVVGAGGLGCPCLQYLVAAGLGAVGIVDGDVVDISNLHRQILFNSADIGKPKASTARQKLVALNPGCIIEAHDFYLDPHNAPGVIDGYDIIVDGSDNFGTRYLVSDVCALLGKPLVYGAVQKFEGQVAIFNAGTSPVQYRDLFPVPPAAGVIANCAEAGVIGVLPGIIGTMQANEVIKLITGIGTPLINRMFTWNALNYQNYELILEPGDAAKGPLTIEKIRETDYAIDCANPFPVAELDAAEFDSLLSQQNVTVIDVREAGELPEARHLSHQQIPLSVIAKDPAGVQLKGDTVLFCQTGTRSKKAANLLRPYTNENVFSLAGGISAWLKLKQKTAESIGPGDA